MWRGETLPEVTLAYECWGELSPAADNAIIIFTGLSPSAHAASSAGRSLSGLVGIHDRPGKAIDTDRFFVVCANSLGGCHGSTGPSSIDPASGEAYGADFPDDGRGYRRFRLLPDARTRRRKTARRGRLVDGRHVVDCLCDACTRADRLSDFDFGRPRPCR